MFASLFASVARTFSQNGCPKVSRQEELCPLLGLPSDLVLAKLLPHLHDTRDLVARKHVLTSHHMDFFGSMSKPSAGGIEVGNTLLQWLQAPGR